MSLEKNQQPKESERKEHEKESYRVKGSYTQEGFYRKPNPQPMNLSNLSQKQSIYDHKSQIHPFNHASDIGYTTLNPSKYAATAGEMIQEQEYEVLAVFELNR